MKTLSRLSVVLIVTTSFLFSCDKAVKRRYEKIKSPLEGVWEMADGKWIVNDSVTRITASDTLRSLKIITGESFSTVHWDCSRNGYGYNGGQFTYENDIYAETLNFMAELDMVGATNYFKIEMGDDHFKMSSCDSLGNVSKYGYFETWRRIQ